MEIEIVIGDITTQNVDAIVNATNSALVVGGGVDGAIHAAAGPELRQATQELYPFGCQTGKAVLTQGFKLPAKYVLHTVGPDCRGYNMKLAEPLLASCYKECLYAAVISPFIQSIAFPSISTGIFGYPRDEAAKVVVDVVGGYAKANPPIDLVRLVCFDQADYNIINSAIFG